MKLRRFLFCFLLLLSFHHSHSQSITLDNLIVFRSGDYEKVNEALLPHNWVFKGSKDIPPDEGTSCIYQEAMWLYAPSSSGQEADAFLAVYKGPIGFDCPASVNYQTADISAYNSIKASIARYKMQQTDSQAYNENDDSYVVTTYEGAKYQVIVRVVGGKNKSGLWRNFYTFTVYAKEEL